MLPRKASSRNPEKTYDSKFKSRVALEALRGELTIAEIASKYQIHPDQVAAMEAAPHEESLTFGRMVLYFFLSKKFPGLNIPRTTAVWKLVLKNLTGKSNPPYRDAARRDSSSRKR